MKKIRVITVILFIAALLLPLLFFNFAPDAVSEIDNRALAGNPLAAEQRGDLTKGIENYVNDRLGFRNEMIRTYTVLNDRVFGKMVHPSYSYGKDGYVFGAGVTAEKDFGDYHIAFADMVKEIQDYCEAREVPFLFVFNPAKPAIYTDKLSDGVNYDRAWVAQFLAELDRRGVNYIDTTPTLQKLRAEGIDGFNQKYDANHWNDLGAYYGTQAALEKLREICPNVHLNDLSEFTVEETLEESLPVSEFPIKEYVPKMTMIDEFERLRDLYADELATHSSYRSFGYFRNETRLAEGCARSLVFQGSYMNSKGEKYFINSFGEYIHVHNYQNVIDFPYYFNIFRPDCVIFEVAEPVFTDGYFPYEKMRAISYNPVLEETEHMAVQVDSAALTVERGEMLTKIFWATEEVYTAVWMTLEETYDMKPADGGYEVTVLTEELGREPEIFVKK